MNVFRNVVLQREHLELLKNAVNVERGSLGGYSIEIETDEPKSYESFVYNGRTAKEDREHDFEIFNRLFSKKTTN